MSLFLFVECEENKITIQHKNIPDAQLHEPKGIATVTVGKIYVSDGAGSGTWVDKSRYGELYITGGTTSQTLSAASAFARLDPGTAWTAGVNAGVTLTVADGTFTIIESGAYHIGFWCVFTTAALAAGTGYKFRYAVNGVPITRQISTTKQTAGVDSLDVSAQGIATLTAGDVLSIYVAGDATSSSTAITVTESGFTLHKA